jgi:hypothetical protein
MDMYDIQNDYGYAYDGEGCYDYESESDYESDYEESYAGNDDTWENRDCEYDSFLSRTCVSEKPSLDKVCGGMTVLAKSRRGAEPKPVQLTAKTSSFKTMMEAKFAAADKAKKEAAENELADRLAEQREAEEKMKEELRLRAVVAHLPTESRAAKERRLKKEAEEKAKADAKAAKEKVWKETTFGHRRNGGGKSRGRYAAEVDAKVVAERRAERRKAAAMNRKMELDSDARRRVVVPTVVKFEKPVIDEKVGEDEARMAWVAAGKESDEFSMTEATKLVEEEEERAEAAAMSEVVGLVASKIVEDKTTKMERVIAEKAAAEVEKKAAEKKAAEEAWTEVKRSSGKKDLVLKMGQASHRERKVKVDTRAVAHEKLSDKKEMEKTLTKTRMCKSVEMGTVCRHGVRCRFAHSLDELVVAPCVFGMECRRVERVGGCYKNCGDRVCNFIHPGEERDAFYLRTGLKKPTSVKVAPPVKAAPPVKTARGWDMSKLNAPLVPAKVEVAVPIPGDGWTTVQRRSPAPKVVGERVVRLCESVAKGIPCRHGANCRFSHNAKVTPTKVTPTKVTPTKVAPTKVAPTKRVVPVCESVVKGVPCRHGVRCRFVHPTPATSPPVAPKSVVEEETVVRVPKEMFLQAMEMAVKSGKTNIRVEIIGS